MLKKLFFTITVLFICIFACFEAYAWETEVMWLAQDDAFDSYSSENPTVNGLTINHVNRYEHSSKMLRGDKVTKFFVLGNYGSTESGYLKFDVKTPSEIYIVGRSNEEDVEREVTIYSTATQKEYAIKMQYTDCYKFNYEGGAGSIYVYAKDMPIRIYSLGYKHYDDPDNIGKTRGRSLKAGLDKYSTVEDFNKHYSASYYIFQTTEKPVSIYSVNKKGEDGSFYTRQIRLNGSGSSQYRSIMMHPKPHEDIYVTAVSSSNTESRQLLLTNKFYENLGLITVTPEVKTYKIPYDQYNEYTLLYSLDGGVNILDITMECRNDSDEQPKLWDFADDMTYKVQNITADTDFDGLSIMPGAQGASIVKSGDKCLRLSTGEKRTASSVRIKQYNKLGDEHKTIDVVASASNDSSYLMLTTSSGWIYGKVQLTTTPTLYTISYDTPNSYVYLYGLTTSGSGYINIYSIASDPNLEFLYGSSKTFNVKKDEQYVFYITGEDINSTDDHTYKIKYDTTKLKYVEASVTDDKTDGFISSISSAVSNDTKVGTLSLQIKRGNQNWSGLIARVSFKALADGETTIYANGVKKG